MKHSLFSPKGRMNRARFILYTSLFLIITTTLNLLLEYAMAEGGSFTLLQLVSLVISVANIILMFIFAIKRCHDFNVNGWLSLIIITGIGYIVLWFIPGSKTENRFGDVTEKNHSCTILFAVLLPLLHFSFGGWYLYHFEQIKHQYAKEVQKTQQQNILQQVQKQLQAKIKQQQLKQPVLHQTKEK
tara:strand:+ start:25744 stop:26301 length:558 start_codon:yes stop_codon:yes gene_type:complete